VIYAIRLLRKSPAFTAVAILTLALGIGANTALFTLVNAVLLKQLPFEHASRLVWIWSTRTDRDKAFYSLPDFVETRASCHAFDGFAAYANWGVNLTGVGEAERFVGARISAYAFEMMGVQALYGRTLASGDDGPASERVVVLSHGLWQRRFGGDPLLVGRKLTLNGDTYTVAGILPPAFVMPNTEAELFVPLVTETDPLRTNRAMNFLRVFARLQSLEQHNNRPLRSCRRFRGVFVRRIPPRTASIPIPGSYHFKTKLPAVIGPPCGRSWARLVSCS